MQTFQSILEIKNYRKECLIGNMMSVLMWQGLTGVKSELLLAMMDRYGTLMTTMLLLPELNKWRDKNGLPIILS